VAVILDTNAVSGILAGDPAIADVLSEEDRHHIPAIVLGEYRCGILRSTRRPRLLKLLSALVRESVVLVVDEGTAEAYGKVREELRRAGRPIPEKDVWIAALARQHRLPVVSRDRHFDAVDGLTRRGW
jgi:predicted nucleic acid-binding protein